MNDHKNKFQTYISSTTRTKTPRKNDHTDQNFYKLHLIFSSPQSNPIKHKKLHNPSLIQILPSLTLYSPEKMSYHISYQCYITLVNQSVSCGTSFFFICKYFLFPLQLLPYIGHVAHPNWPMLHNIGNPMVPKCYP